MKCVLPSRIDRPWLAPVLALVLFAAAWTPGRADETAILRGRVLDARRLPLPGAGVTVEGRAALSVRTDEDGAFALAGLPAGTYAVRVESPGLRPSAPSRPDHRAGRAPLCCGSSSRRPSSLLFQARTRSSWTNRPSPPERRSPRLRSRACPPPIRSGRSSKTRTSGHDQPDRRRRTLGNAALPVQRARCDIVDPERLPAQRHGRLRSLHHGAAPVLPDFFSLAATQLSNADHPASAFHPGGQLDLIPRDATPDFRGGFSGYYIDKSMSASNITPGHPPGGPDREPDAQQPDRIQPPFLRPDLGPRPPVLRFGHHAIREPEHRRFRARRHVAPVSGLVHVRYERPRSVFRFFWTGQKISDPTLGAGRSVAFASTIRRDNASNILQVSWETPPQEAHRFRAGLGYAGLRSSGETQGGSRAPQTLDLFQPWTPLPMPAATRARGSRAGSRANPFSPTSSGPTICWNTGSGFRSKAPPPA